MSDYKWEKFCDVLRNRLDALCKHNATKVEAYEDIKDEVTELLEDN